MAQGLAGLWAYLGDIRNDIRTLKQRVKSTEAAVTILGGGVSLSGEPMATFTGTAAIGSSKPIMWSGKVITDDDYTYSGSRMQFPADMHFAATWTLDGAYPRGYTKYDYIDGVRVEVIKGGNSNAQPEVTRGFVMEPSSPVKCHGTIHGYGNSLALGVSSVSSHISGASEPTGIKVTLVITEWIRG